jgi:arsenate reductase-like glutaredoxin family protein
MKINERDFFKYPFDRDEIEELLKGESASEMCNFKSPSFKKLGIEQDKLNNKELINFMLQEPRLIHRPVVRIGKKVYFGANKAILENLLS